MERGAPRDWKARLFDLAPRLHALSRVARKSGILREVRWRGLRAAAAGIARGASGPSQIYRIHAANTPDKIALYWRDRVLSFGDIDAGMDRVARALARRGLIKGTRILVMMRNRPEFLLMHGGISRIGGAAVSVSWRSTMVELSYLASHCGATGIAFEQDLWPVVEETVNAVPEVGSNLFIVGAGEGEAPRGCVRFEDLEDVRTDLVADKTAEEDAVMVIYTSGTTGKPKGAVRKFPRNTMAAALEFVAQTPMCVDDVHLVPCPLYHATAFGFLAFTHLLGASAVLMDEFKPEPFLETIERFGVTTVAVVPTMMQRVLGLGDEVLARHRTSSIRAIFSTGAPFPGPLARDVMDRFGDVLYNLYGATEFGVVTLATPADLRAAPGTIGRRIPGTEIRLQNDAGEDVKDGEVGELWVKTKLVVKGYHDDREATDASMRRGFFSVGDLARKDAEGRYFLEGRTRDMVISGGVNVYPAEVEAVLEAHPAVAEAAVVGVEDAQWGERVRAFVVRKEGSDLDAEGLKAWALARLSGPKVPRDYVFIGALPRNPTGKVLKRELRKEA